MQKTKLISLLKTFTKQEMRDFEKFISSPYFSHVRNLKPLFKALKKFYPSFNTSNFTEEKIFRSINPGKKYEKEKSNHSLQVLVSEMTLLAEKFLAFELIQKEKDGYYMYSALCDAMLFRNLRNNRHNLILKNLEYVKNTYSIRMFFREMIELYADLQESYHYFNKFQQSADCTKKLSLYIHGQMMMLLSKQLNDYLTNTSKSWWNPESIKLIEMSINSFDPEIFKRECYDDGLGTKQLILTFYYAAKSQLNHYNEEDLMVMIETYKQNYFKFKNNSQYQLFVMILNICFERKLTVDIVKYSLIGSDLSNFVIKNGLFENHNGTRKLWSLYKAIFSMKKDALGYDDLKSFVDTWFEKIYPEDRELMFEYSYAWLSFKNNDYEKTLAYLSKFSTKDIVLNNYALMLRIASLYSLDHVEETIYCMNSYEHYLRNNKKVSGRIKIDASLFIKSVRSLIKLQSNSKRTYVDTLGKIIEENKNNQFHIWFKEKVEELRAKLG